MLTSLKSGLRRRYLANLNDTLDAALALSHCLSVLHIGAFNSPFAEHQKQQGREVTLLDRRLDPDAEGRFVQGDARKMPFSDGSFDCVLDPYVLHSVSADDQAQIIEECCRCLSPNGMLAIADFPQTPSWGLWDCLFTLEEALIGLLDFKHFQHYLSHRNMKSYILAQGRHVVLESDVIFGTKLTLVKQAEPKRL